MNDLENPTEVIYSEQIVHLRKILTMPFLMTLRMQSLHLYAQIMSRISFLTMHIFMHGPTIQICFWIS